MRLCRSLLLTLFSLSFALGPNLSFAAPSDEIGCHCTAGHAEEASAAKGKRPPCHTTPASIGTEADGAQESKDEACRCRTRTTVAGSTCSCRHHGIEGISLPDRTLLPPTLVVAYSAATTPVATPVQGGTSAARLPETPPPRSSLLSF